MTLDKTGGGHNRGSHSGRGGHGGGKRGRYQPKSVGFKKQFDKKNTAQDKFFLPDGNSVLVDMMVQESEIPYAVLDNIGSTMVELPYKGDRQGSIFYQIFEEWTNSRPDFRGFFYRNSHQLTIYFSSKPHMFFWQNIDP